MVCLNTERKAGRPTKYSDQLADTICARIADGESLRQICSGEGMPDRRNVAHWLEQRPEFATKYARAREMQADYMDDLILETARTCTPETVHVAKVRISAYQWRAAKLKPKVYGDHAGGPQVVNNIQHNMLVCDEATRARIIEQRRRLLGGKPDAILEAGTLPESGGSDITGA
jgi:hypothetical protein